MAKLTSLNPRQRALLQRIVEGADPVTRADASFVTSVNALSTRGLVIKRRTTGGQWTAEATEAGRAEVTGDAPTLVVGAARARTRTQQASKLTSRGGHTLVERVRLPSSWPAILQPTVDAVSQGRPNEFGRLVVRSRDEVLVDVDASLRGRVLQLLAAMDEGVRGSGLSWARTEPVGATLSSGTSADEQRVGVLAVGEPYGFLFATIREVGYWRSDSTRRLAFWVGGRSWAERQQADGLHSFNVERAVQDIGDLVQRARDAHQRLLEREREEERLDDLYAEERRAATKAMAGRWWVSQARERMQKDALDWENADRLRRFAAAIREECSHDKGWMAYEALIAFDAGQVDPLGGLPPELKVEATQADLAPMMWRWPEKRPSSWTPSPPVKRRRRRA